jgi:hypothetical protein
MIDERAATAATDVKPTVWDGKACLRCHTDKQTLKLMQDKAGESTYCQAAYDELTAHGKSNAYSATWKK